MASASCNAFSNVSNGGSVAALAIQGAIGLAVGYRSVGSPYSTLRDAWDTLLNIKTHLEAVTPERRQKIEAAAALRQCKTLTGIEGEFRDLWDAHTVLSQKYAESSYIQRHVFWELRSLINRLEVDVNTLLMDTWTTTRAAQALASTLPSGDQGNSTRITPASQATSPSSPIAIRESIEMAAV